MLITDLLPQERPRERLLAKGAESLSDAALIAMPDAFDEVYQGVMQNPTSSDAVQRLQQAVERMRVEDELGAAVDEDLASLFKDSKGAAAQRQAGARARRQSA